MTVRSVLYGEFGYNYGNFVYLVKLWAGTRSLPGLEAWFDQLSEYSARDQADIVADWIDCHCNSNEADSCVQYLMDMETDITYDSQGNAVDNDGHLYNNMGYYIGD